MLDESRDVVSHHGEHGDSFGGRSSVQPVVSVEGVRPPNSSTEVKRRETKNRCLQLPVASSYAWWTNTWPLSKARRIKRMTRGRRPRQSARKLRDAHGCTMAESDKLCTRCPADLRVKLAKVIVTEATADVKQKHQERATWRQKRPDAEWRHAGGTPVEDLVIQSDREIWSENSR